MQWGTAKHKACGFCLKQGQTGRGYDLGHLWRLIILKKFLFLNGNILRAVRHVYGTQSRASPAPWQRYGKCLDSDLTFLCSVVGGCWDTDLTPVAKRSGECANPAQTSAVSAAKPWNSVASPTPLHKCIQGAHLNT